MAEPEIKKEEEKTPVEKLKAENDAHEAELLRKEKLRQQAAMAPSAGIRPPTPPAKEETPKEYVKRIYGA